MISKYITAGQERQRHVSVIGAGPAGLTFAAELENHGFAVLVYAHPAHAKHITHITQKGCMNISGVIKGSMLPMVTHDMRDVVEFADVIVLTVPSTGQNTVLKELMPFCLHKHTIIAIPGNMFSLVAESVGLSVGCILETNLSPYSCRLTDQSDLLVLGKKKSIHIAGLQRDLNSDFKKEIACIFPTVALTWCVNITEVFLNNVNGVFHPLMMLMNAGRIESTGGDFLLYRDGLTQSVAAAMTRLDQVRVQIGAALGFQLHSALHTSNECYNHTFVDLVDLAINSGPHKHLKAPADIDHRNISEDVPDVLVFWHDLAVRLGIDASPIAAVIVLAGMATGTDFMQHGRSLKSLKLANHPRIELVEKLGGFSPSLPSPPLSPLSEDVVACPPTPVGANVAQTLVVSYC